MKEFVLVEFMCEAKDAHDLSERIKALEEDFEFQKSTYSDETDEDGYNFLYYQVWGKISSEAASFIRLQDSFLAERMRISYIPESLKDKYRTKK